MPLASSLQVDGFLRALFVGSKHSGKTVAACSVYSKEGNKRVKVLDGDGRIRGILGAPWIDPNRIEYDYIPPRLGPGNTYFNKVNDILASMMIDVGNGKSPYETYVGDSLTAFTKNLILDAVPLTHAKGANNEAKGKSIGGLQMPGPEDFGFESVGTDQYLSYLRSLPMNLIVTAHTVDKYDKPRLFNSRGQDIGKDTYAESVVVGEKLSLRDKIGQNTTIYFDHIFKFYRDVNNGTERFSVEFIGDIACTSFPNMPVGKVDITGKNFYQFLLQLVRDRNPGLYSNEVKAV